MRNAAKEPKEKEGITLRRTDKTAAFVLIRTEEYFDKLDAILSDTTKFKRLLRNPTEDIKREANKIISTVNAATNAVYLPPIDFDHCYLRLLEGSAGDLYEAGIAMGPPLGILLANFYMGTVEECVFERVQQPKKCARYIDDDVFVQADSEEEVEALCQAFQQCSVLNYTVEFSTDERLPFLDVMVTKTERNLKTSVYTKSTNLGLCLNGDSECPARFKNTMVRTFIRRALSHCSTWQDTNKEFERAAQMLYREDESSMKKIVMENITPTEDNKRINLVIYYKNHHTRDLVMKNNPSPPARDPSSRRTWSTNLYVLSEDIPVFILE
ncbi:uncharacterized protein [Macrobrachium rosenbergii]|uniref:uncharacterized protein n=1 Tax=Macrobrachium rosenbergii TaxID=79674 RepID=UPI0034D7B46F